MKRLTLFALAVAMLASCATKAPQEANTPENPILTIEGGQVQGVNTDIEGVVVYHSKLEGNVALS